MPTLPIPVQRYLVSDRQPTIPEGFTQVDSKILAGIPHIIQLDQITRLIVVVPTGLATTWRDIDPTTVVSQSDDQLAPCQQLPRAIRHLQMAGLTEDKIAQALNLSIPDLQAIALQPGESIAEVKRAPARIIVQRSGLPMIAIPLVAGLQRITPDSGAFLELILLSWDIRAGSLRGIGDFGSRISLAWKQADQAASEYSPPAINPFLMLRLEPQFRLESNSGKSAALL
ncbi:hypothetical protein [Nostoc sp. ChiQUE01b]|uniref:hypothetical protein n=1 Tax=Nostoc sp. ChiQUE01b TaxID=3075376 RepID=UPI002AD3D96C|nr:hypothetical protein [Nostoc sp. ChiQUE01b]MDZ8258030.1 hypothetical protein [Nostoc sp. ChiQUE01b]